ncbi:MAG: electron transfer flavoprotein subunit alpha/FixB family protein [Gammaproteobacteria bacterium]
MRVLIIAEHENNTLKPVNLNTLSAAIELGKEIDVLIVGHRCEAVIEEAKQLLNVQKIVVADAKEYEHQLAENIASLIAKMASNYNYVLAGATTYGKNLLPRVAALLDVGMIADVVKIIDLDTFVRPIYAGNALATVKTKDALKLMTIRNTAFAAAKKNPNSAIQVESLSEIIPNELSQFIKQELTASARPELTSARIIISGGRGLKSAENFKLLEKLADRLGAAIGASRAAVDAGFAPNDYQVGQTGKVVAPDLYIAVGISGAIQHLAGMKDSKVIVAINADPDAPIFEVADYGLVGDLFKILPELEAELNK